MEQILAAKGREAWATSLERPYDFESPFGGLEFAMLLVVHDTTIRSEEQRHLSDQFVGQGCRYAVCAGHRCSSWDDSIDMAHLATDPNFEFRESTVVMTTWHEEESIEEVAEFFAYWARWDGFEPERFLVVVLGGDDASYFAVRHTALVQLQQSWG